MREIVGKEPLGARETPAVGDQWGDWHHFGVDLGPMHSNIATGGLHDHARGGHHLKEMRKHSDGQYLLRHGEESSARRLGADGMAPIDPS